MMNTFLASIFSDPGTEFTSLLAAGIDQGDWALTPAQLNTLSSSTSSFFVTSPVTTHGFFEIEFDNSNNFWGVNSNFGNDAAGVHFRQGIAHLIDKKAFALSDPGCLGKCVPMDNTPPPSDGLVTPINCSWDASHLQTSNCIVGSASGAGATGGTAYHLADVPATDICVPSTSTVCAFPWMRGEGTLDFCAAADHFIAAFAALGETVSRDATTCVLTSVPASATAHPVNIYVRLDIRRHDLGTGLAETICALFGQGYIVGCNTSGSARIVSSTTAFSAGDILTVMYGPITTFPGFSTCKSSTGSCTPKNDWHMYTAAFLGEFPYDVPLYFGYNGLFTSNPDSTSDPSNFCASTSTTTSAGNYQYVCVPAYDSLTARVEFANCGSSPNPSGAPDPTPGQTTATFASCSGTVVTGVCGTTTNCTAVSAGYQAEDLYGHGVYTLPIFTGSDQYAYLAPPTGCAWSRVVNNVGAGLPNTFKWKNEWCAPGTQAIRQGFSQPTTSLNPYVESTVWDAYILGNVYDSIYALNPLSNNQVLDWMTKNHQLIDCGGLCTSSQVGYTPSPGTTKVITNTLRSDIFFQNGVQVTAWDVAYSYLSLIKNGAFQTSGLSATISGITVKDNNHFDLELFASGPFTDVTIGGATVLPGSIWYSPPSGCPTTWSALIAQTVPHVFDDVSGNANCMDTTSTKSGLHFDPLSNGILIGSGEWTCENPNPPSGTTAAVIGTACSSDGTQAPAPGGTFTLTRYGCYITNPTGIVTTTCKSTYNSPSSQFYFRSSSRFAQYLWTRMNGNQAHDVLNVITASGCSTAVFNPTAPCPQWEQGIGNTAGDGVACCGLLSGGALPLVRIAADFLYDWTSPFAFPPTSAVLTGVDTIPPVLYEGSVTISPSGSAVHPCSTAGQTYGNPTNPSVVNSNIGYDC
jgi:hypothetical protein